MNCKIAKKFNILPGAEAGVSLIETLIALAIMGIIAASFLGGMAASSQATITADERATAESLGRSQMEYVKSQGYISYAEPGHGEYALITTPDGYSVETTATPIDAETGDPLSEGEDNGLQKITVEAKHENELVITLENYKVNR